MFQLCEHNLLHLNIIYLFYLSNTLLRKFIACLNPTATVLYCLAKETGAE